MRDIDENDPRHVVALIEAAINLDTLGLARKPIDNVNDARFKIAMLRAASYGWREIYWFFNPPQPLLSARDARHNARLITGRSKDSDRQADRLCRQIKMQFEYQGHHENLASLIWTAFKNIYLELNSSNLAWALLAYELVKGDQSCGLLTFLTNEVTHGGTAESRAIWNARAKELQSIAEQKRAERDVKLAQIKAKGLTTEMLLDRELEHYAYMGVTAMVNLDRAYRRSCPDVVSAQ